MSWINKYTYDKDGNKKEKTKYQPQIVREGYFIRDLKNDEYMDFLHKEWIEELRWKKRKI